MKNLKSVSGTIREAWLKGVKAVGEGASNLADNAKFRLDELNLENARRDSLGNISLTVYELWKRGVAFPQEVTAELEKLEKLDEQLNDLRAQKLQSDLARKGSGEEETEPEDVFEEETVSGEPAEEEQSEETAQPEEEQPAPEPSAPEATENEQ